MTHTKMPVTGTAATTSYTVRERDTAETLGSGDLPVLATPRLVAWAEYATRSAIAGDLDDASTSVGTRVDIEHLRPSPVDAAVSVRAELTAVDGRSMRFDVSAAHDDGGVVGQGEVVRMVVDRDRFLPT